MLKCHHHIAPLLKSLLWLLGALEMRDPHSSLRPMSTPALGAANLSSILAASLTPLQPLGSFPGPSIRQAGSCPGPLPLCPFVWDFLPLTPFP